MKHTLYAVATVVFGLCLAGCTGASKGTSDGGPVTAEREAEIEAAQASVMEEERAHFRKKPR